MIVDRTVTQIVERFLARLDEVVERCLEAIWETVPAYERAGENLRNDVRRSVRENVAALSRVLSEGRELKRDELHLIERAGARRAEAGIPLDDVLHAYRTVSRVCWVVLAEETRNESSEDALEAAIRLAEKVLAYTDEISTAVAESYVQAQRSIVREQEGARREFLADLLYGTEASPEDVLGRAHSFGYDLTLAYLAIVGCGPKGDAGRETAVAVAAGRAAEFPNADPIVLQKGEMTIALLPMDPFADSSVVPEKLMAELGGGWEFGVGGPGPGLEGVRRAYLEAREALEIGMALDLGGSVYRFDDLLLYHFLRLEPVLVERFVEQMLGPLIEYDGRRKGELVKTLEAYFSADGSVKMAGEILFAHPHTVTYRLKQIEKLTGWSLRDPEDKLRLLLALRANRLAASRKELDSLMQTDWSEAKAHFEALAATDDPPAEALDGLGRALWWLKDVRGAIEVRTQAFRAYKKAGRTEEAARVAVWLARELRTLFMNEAAASGWLARAETLAGDANDNSVAGWISLARAEAAARPEEAMDECSSALATARDQDDGDLEIVALARLGMIEIAIGEVDTGIKHLDESMAAGAAGEAQDPQSMAEAYCALMEAGELLGDANRFSQWTAAMTDLKLSHGLGPLGVFGSTSGYGNLSVFCASCCGGLYLVTGALGDAEDELRTAIVELEESGLQSRCVHPVTQLAELRVLQGRFEEARVLLENYEDLPEAIRPLAVLDLALGEPESAAARLKQRIGDMAAVPVSALPLHSLLVDAYLATGDLDSAESSADAIRTVAGSTASKRHEGEALFAEGKVKRARGAPEASAALRAAAHAFSEASMSLAVCRARFELARSLVDADRPLSISEARSALTAFERLGATPDADAAAAFLRDLGVKGRTGPKNLELLTKREVEVLRLVAQGLSNSEIAERLFISVKTSGHHVSNILSKLGLRSRTEAAAYAAVHLPAEPATR